MSAMSELTLRLCEHDLGTLYSHVFLLSDFVLAGNLETIIYEHGVLVSPLFSFTCVSSIFLNLKLNNSLDCPQVVNRDAHCTVIKFIQTVA